MKVQLAGGPGVISATQVTTMSSGAEEVDGALLLQAVLERYVALER